MQNVSNEFKQAMQSRPYIARVTVQGEVPLQSDAVKEIVFRSGSNSGENAIVLGSTFSGSVEITLDKSAAACAFENRELTVELGIELSGGIEWLPMGKYTADNPVDADGILTVTAKDALSAKLDIDYEALPGFDFTSEGGVSSIDFWKALCARRGVETAVDGLSQIPLKVSPEGFTERQIVGFIAALYGGYAYVDRTGVLKIGHYSPIDVRITPDEYYSDGLEKAAYSFSAGWLKCYNEIADLSMFVGDFDATQGIHLQSIWMTQAILNGLYDQLANFSYRPVDQLSFLGNPLIDPGDIIVLEDATGSVFSVPAMTLTHEYDGGLTTSITACGQAVTSEYTGPTRKAVARSIAAARAYTDSENSKLDQLELLKRLTKSWIDEGIYLTEDGKLAINASAILSGVIGSADGKIVIDLTAGSSGPVFNTGISTNGITVRGDEAGAAELFKIEVLENAEGVKHAYISFRDVEGNIIIALTEDSSRTGGGIEIKNNSGTLTAIAQATDTSAGFRILHNGATAAYLAVNQNGTSVLQVDEINCSKMNGNSV